MTITDQMRGLLRHSALSDTTVHEARLTMSQYDDDGFLEVMLPSHLDNHICVSGRVGRYGDGCVMHVTMDRTTLISHVFIFKT